MNEDKIKNQNAGRKLRNRDITVTQQIIFISKTNPDKKNARRTILATLVYSKRTYIFFTCTGNTIILTVPMTISFTPKTAQYTRTYALGENTQAIVCGYQFHACPLDLNMQIAVSLNYTYFTNLPAIRLRLLYDFCVRLQYKIANVW